MHPNRLPLRDALLRGDYCVPPRDALRVPPHDPHDDQTPDPERALPGIGGTPAPVQPNLNQTSSAKYISYDISERRRRRVNQHLGFCASRPHSKHSNFKRDFRNGTFVTLKWKYFTNLFKCGTIWTNQIASFDQPMKSDQSDCFFCSVL